MNIQKSALSRACARALVTLLFTTVAAFATIGTPLQMQLGNPSAAGTDPIVNRTNYLLQRPQFAQSHNDTTRDPNWVAWNLTAGDSGSSGRSSVFFADTALPAGFYQVLPTDYSGSGYDRGHMCPSGDRTLSRADNDVTFFMSNMVPQTPDNNQGVWASFETYCRTLASAGNEVLIITGPGGFAGSTLASGVAIPGYTWKIAVVVPLGAGTALSRVTAGTRVITIKVPNIAGVRSNPWQQYLVSTAQLETDTGFTFFTALPTAIASALRAKIDDATSTGTPRITTQPAAQTASLGGSATFTVAATGNTPLAYQWTFDGNEIAGATAATLTLASVQVAQLGAYSVVVTNTLGSITSATAALNLGSGAGSLYWDFALATPAGGLPADLTGGTVIQGGNNGTTALLTAVSVASGYTGVSGGNNAGAAARTGPLNRTPATGSAYFEFTVGAVAGKQLVFSSLSFGARSTGTGPQAFAIFTSLDDFAAPLAAGPLANDSAWRFIAPAFPAFAAAPGTSVTFRLYGSNGTGNTGVSTANWRIDDLRLGVNIVSNSTTPSVITRQPGNTIVIAGRTATLTAAATGTPAPTFQWRKDGIAIPGTTSDTLTLTNVTTAQAGTYTVVITNSATSVTSSPAYLTVLRRSYAGTYFGSVQQFDNTLTGIARTCVFHVNEDNSGEFLARVHFAKGPLPPPTGLPPTLPTANPAPTEITPEHTRTYVYRGFQVDDSGHFVFSAEYYITSPPSAPTEIITVARALPNLGNRVEGSISEQGLVRATLGGTLPVSATRSAETSDTISYSGFYQARAASSAAQIFAIVGPAGQAFVVAQTSATTDSGTGTINPAGTATISTFARATITLDFSTASGALSATFRAGQGETTTFTGLAETSPALASQRLANLSTRASAGTGDQSAIVGFVIAGLESKTVLVRAIGPALRDFGVSTALAAPRLELVRGTTNLATNTGWSTAANAAEIATTAARVGAFPLAAGSADSVVLTALAPGHYTALVSSANAIAGPALVEVYDVSGGSLLQKLSNLSTRAVAGTGDNTLIAGVVVTGTVPKRVLIRAAGPSLTPFGLTGALARPQLTLLAGTTPLATNSGWIPAAIAEAASRVGAFAFAAGSADAALIINLAPGAYTAQVTGVGGTTGLALVEVYEVP